jgi:hypothetical protein
MIHLSYYAFMFIWLHHRACLKLTNTRRSEVLHMFRRMHVSFVLKVQRVKYLVIL